MRERLYRVEAVILKRADMGEADRLLTMITADRGKLRAVAKGARKPSSRKSGHVELFNRVNLLIAKGREIDVITQADTVETFSPLRQDLDRLSHAYYLAELLDRFGEENTESAPLYDLTLQSLRWLGEAEDCDLTVRFVELKLLSLVGYRPQLFRCAHCGAEIEPVQNLFTAEGGGVLDPRCGNVLRDAQPISLNALKVLRYLQTHDYAVTRELRVSPPVHVELEPLMQRFISYHLERKLKSVDFLNTLRGTPKTIAGSK